MVIGKSAFQGDLLLNLDQSAVEDRHRDQILKDVQLSPVEIDQIEMAPTNYGYLTHIELISLTLLTARNLVRMLGL
ncbi:hypothetical protein EFS54_07480 [Periweissella beninensis]|uniref:Uncharacterized protein n=1 Tax=Periweissella beninensis TaxID=504936 RepID=A0ABT0VGZ1_9LACO|nr:hypothetical protein [Periweissella beninensis]MCT4396836.1 hypothetical protein [Periweissella beninensis]